MSKISVKAVLFAYLSTLRVNRNGKEIVSIIDVLVQVGLPVLAGVLSMLLGFRLRGISNLIAGVAVVSALLGAVAVFLFQTRMQLDDKMNRGRTDNEGFHGAIFDDEDIKVLDELFFSVMWCILVGALVCAVLIVCDCAGVPTDGDLVDVWTFVSCLVSIFACNLLLVLLMCVKRMARLYERFGMHKSKDELA